MEKIVLEFERITKYPLLAFLVFYRDFMVMSYPSIDDYFSGRAETIKNEHLVKLKLLDTECITVMAYFKTFANKFNTCGYWELMETIQNLNDTIEKIRKLPKFRRTSLTFRNYKPVIQVEDSVGSFKTVEDTAREINQKQVDDNYDWVDIMLNNDWNEWDWEIDRPRKVSVFINNNTQVVVTTILEQPIGEKVYGKDLHRKITIVEDDADLDRVIYKENIQQKCDILLKLQRGDVPENRLFGTTKLIGQNVNNFSYPILVSDIINNFMQNDLFDYVTPLNFSFSNGSLQAEINIKTKYNYDVTKTISL